MAVRPIDANELLGIERLLDTDVVRQSKTASWLLNQVLHDIQAMPTLTPQNEPERAGLYGKYTVYKNKDGSLVTDCFILRPAKDPAAIVALRAYAAATDNAELAADTTNWVGAEPSEWVKVMEAINNAAVAYIEGGPYENDLPGMEFALKIDRLSRDFVRPPEGDCEIKDCAETCEECGFCDNTLASPPEGEDA